MESAIAEHAGVDLSRLHWDAQAIVHAYRAIAPLCCDVLRVLPPQPALAGLSYVHLSTLGAEVAFPPNSEPAIHRPVLAAPQQIDALAEPDDYLAAGLVPARLRARDELAEALGTEAVDPGLKAEGPVTTAVLLFGPQFFTLPYDDPQRAHRLLEFCVRSAVNFQRAAAEHEARPWVPGPVGMPDDFGGAFPPKLFAEFVVPHWQMYYEGMSATERYLHSELLRVEHLPWLAELGITEFDPGVDQYLTPEALAQSCPVPFSCRFSCWQQREMSAEELDARYRQIAALAPRYISFELEWMDNLPKALALLQVARELAGEERAPSRP